MTPLVSVQEDIDNGHVGESVVVPDGTNSQDISLSLQGCFHLGSKK